MTGFISSSISHLLPKANKGQNNDNRLGFVLIWVGLGNVVAGYASGWLADKISIKVSSYIGHSVLAMNSLLIWFSSWGGSLKLFLSYELSSSLQLFLKVEMIISSFVALSKYILVCEDFVLM